MKRIIFVPGKNPKPPEDAHRDLLLRCLLHGVESHDAGTAEDIRKAGCFSLAAWNHSFYERYRNTSDIQPWVERMLSLDPQLDISVKHMRPRKYRLARLLYQLGDTVPAIIQLIPDERIKDSIADTERYFANKDNIACKVRHILKEKLRQTAKDGDRVLLIAHSMGSVIAWDSLYELHHLEGISDCVHHWLTIGSPLGMNYVQRRLLGLSNSHPDHYPGNIRTWSNVSARGDLVALDPALGNDFRAMIEGGYVERIEDYKDRIFNHYQDEKGLNVHKSYGYLVNPVVSKIVTDWWCRE